MQLLEEFGYCRVIEKRGGGAAGRHVGDADFQGFGDQAFLQFEKAKVAQPVSGVKAVNEEIFVNL